jgi:hypothetical protein
MTPKLVHSNLDMMITSDGLIRDGGRTLSKYENDMLVTYSAVSECFSLIFYVSSVAPVACPSKEED